jgi:hypothetical protein
MIQQDAVHRSAQAIGRNVEGYRETACASLHLPIHANFAIFSSSEIH